MNAPHCFMACLFLIFFLFFTLGCEESEEWIEEYSSYLEIEEFPGYIRRIPLFGVNGHSGLKPPEKESQCSAYGVYVSSNSKAFLRAFNDSVLYHIPLKDHLSFPSECTIVRIEGKIVQNGEPFVSGARIISAVEFETTYQMVLRGYPKLIDKAILNPILTYSNILDILVTNKGVCKAIEVGTTRLDTPSD